MKRRTHLLFVLVAFCWAACARADLETDVRAVLQDKLLQRAEVAVEVAQLGAKAADAHVVLAINHLAPLSPASNLKLCTTAAALDKLGADFKLRTLLARHGEDLVIIGDGDPTFGDAELLKKSNWTTTTVFQHWAELLKKKNIAAVNDVLVDDSVFDEVFFHPHWADTNLHKRYSAQVGGFNLNVNCVDFYLKFAGYGKPVTYNTDPATSYITVQNRCLGDRANSVWLTRAGGKNEVMLGGTSPGNIDPISVTVHDPPLYGATVFAQVLDAEGIKVRGRIARDRTVRAKLLTKSPDPAFALLAIHETPLAQVITRANKESMNLYAECVCKRLGFAMTGESGSWESGTAAVGAYLKKLGIDERQFKLDDGCGLSKDNAISADAVLMLLISNFHGKNAETFLGSLPIAGHDGTLEKRFDTAEVRDLRGRVIAKTGFINQVVRSSGLLKTKNERWYAFSILMNGTPLESNWKMKTLQEQIVKAIDVNAK